MATMLSHWTRKVKSMFITEWGRYQYLRMSQGFKAAGDVYTCHDELIEHIPNKVKIVDDILLHKFLANMGLLHPIS